MTYMSHSILFLSLPYSTLLSCSLYTHILWNNRIMWNKPSLKLIKQARYMLQKLLKTVSPTLKLKYLMAGDENLENWWKKCVKETLVTVTLLSPRSHFCQDAKSHYQCDGGWNTAYPHVLVLLPMTSFL